MTTTTEGKIPVYLIRPVDMRDPVVVEGLDQAMDYLRELVDSSEVGDGVRIDLAEMTRAELDELPEHRGW